ncbi:MAG: sulfurtransferase [Gammaproteobacteria bacterium]|nr:sulfurtransferase [Gammaproteobacteria bacterium]
MNKLQHPLILDANELEDQLSTAGLIIIDLSKIDNYKQQHIPGAIFLDYGKITRMERPIMGLLPTAESFIQLLSSLGIHRNSHIVACDDEGGGKAARLLWTLDLIGHSNFSLLNGGMHSWINEGHPTTQDIPQVTATHYDAASHYLPSGIADKAYIMEHLNDDDCQILDARSAIEYNGQKAFSQKAGHIPGAIHFEWTEAIDMNNNLRLKETAQIEAALQQHGLVKDKEIIAYCQSHHRSAFSCIVLKSLGYEKVRGYPGSWSDWGNSPETPVEI